MFEIDPPRPMRVLLVLAALAGLALGAMAGSRVAGTDEPLPSNEEIAALAEFTWGARDFRLSAESGSVEDRASQREHEDFGGLPGWAQVLVGDDTQDRRVHVVWGPPAEYVEPYVDAPETAEANASRREDVAARFAADGWKVTRTSDHTIECRKDTLLVEFNAYEVYTPSLSVSRVQSASYPWFLLGGALLGGLGAVMAIRALDRFRARHGGGAGLVRAGVGLLMLNTAFVFATVSDDLTDGHLDDPLWRAGRWVPFGATMNLALVLLTLAALAVWRRARRSTTPSEA
ncbi:hypothetical protein Afil01_08040 [Actinorhabdospora filicis]|uniref:DUF2812 domain-containing protein n=1 Tax=Actinorhabdospora filicis TaxID=1785913 RepID=A0A9W6W1K6_9ACTN|nr:hypothetical protein [Actinorhabdospora filicis]GLZ75997.1 hypothetical protein Afil01_08040 [Actinorhabdospora filicis]